VPYGCTVSHEQLWLARLKDTRDSELGRYEEPVVKQKFGLNKALNTLLYIQLSTGSLVSITEELLGRNSSGSGQENREYERGDPLR
jgi:hypothetical protein